MSEIKQYPQDRPNDGRGYGVSSQGARSAASRIEVPGCTAEHIQAELERVALAM